MSDGKVASPTHLLLTFHSHKFTFLNPNIHSYFRMSTALYFNKISLIINTIGIYAPIGRSHCKKVKILDVHMNDG